MNSMSPNRIGIAMVLGLACTVASAAEPTNITAGELALTPPFCQDVQTINGWSQYGHESPRAPHWVSLMGKTFWGMHHYCWALVNIQRSKAAGLSKQMRDFMIHSAIADHYFVVNIAPPSFVLLPEIYFRIGEAHVMVQEYPQAIAAFEKSREIKPDYWPPYVAQAELLEKMGMKSKALALLDEGLQKMPGEPTLTRHVKRLGGKPPAIAQASTGASAPDLRASPASAPQ